MEYLQDANGVYVLSALTIFWGGLCLLWQTVVEYWYIALIASVFAYLLGSVNTSIIVTRIFTRKDIRKMGSGNAGFTNVLRSVGKIPAIITFAGDFLKGVIAVMAVRLLVYLFALHSFDYAIPCLVYIAGFFCVIGHMFPLFYGFRGGKGVLTTASFTLAADWRIFVALIVVFIIMFLFTKTISKSAIVSAVCLPIFTFFFAFVLDVLPLTVYDDPLNQTLAYEYMVAGAKTIIALIIAVLVIIRHKENIKRILSGTEKKITSKKTKQE